MAKTGRRGKYTPERVQKLCDALRMGASYAHAAGYAGIAERTLYEWLAAGRENPRSRFAELVEKVAQAEGQGAMVDLAVIARAAKRGDWRAAAWKLERKGYGRPSAVEVSGRLGVDVSAPEEALRELQRQLRTLSDEALAGMGPDGDDDGDDG